MAPELSRISVLTAGIPHASTGWKGLPSGPLVGQAAWNPGQGVKWAPNDASQGTEMLRS